MKLTDHSVHLVHEACRFLSSRGLEMRVRHKLSRVALGTRMIIFSPSCQLVVLCYFQKTYYISSPQWLPTGLHRRL